MSIRRLFPVCGAAGLALPALLALGAVPAAAASSPSLAPTCVAGAGHPITGARDGSDSIAELGLRPGSWQTCRAGKLRHDRGTLIGGARDPRRTWTPVPRPTPTRAVSLPATPVPASSSPGAPSPTVTPLLYSPHKAAQSRQAVDPAATRTSSVPAESAGDPEAPTEITVAGLPDTGWPVWSGLTGLILIVLGTIIAWEQLRRVVWPALLVYAAALMNWIDRRMDLR